MRVVNVQTFGVFLHSSGERGGYVVRTIHDGWCPAPYSSAAPVKVYRREYAAQNHADRLNAPLFGQPITREG